MSNNAKKTHDRLAVELEAQAEDHPLCAMVFTALQHLRLYPDLEVVDAEQVVHWVMTCLGRTTPVINNEPKPVQLLLNALSESEVVKRVADGRQSVELTPAPERFRTDDGSVDETKLNAAIRVTGPIIAQYIQETHLTS